MKEPPALVLYFLLERLEIIKQIGHQRRHSLHFTFSFVEAAYTAAARHVDRIPRKEIVFCADIDHAGVIDPALTERIPDRETVEIGKIPDPIRFISAETDQQFTGQIVTQKSIDRINLKFSCTPARAVIRKKYVIPDLIRYRFVLRIFDAHHSPTGHALKFLYVIVNGRKLPTRIAKNRSCVRFQQSQRRRIFAAAK